MRVVKLAADPLWQCLCPSWISTSSRTLHNARLTASRPRTLSFLNDQCHKSRRLSTQVGTRRIEHRSRDEELLSKLDNKALYARLEECANGSQDPVNCRMIAKYLIQNRGEQPSVHIYSALIGSNVNAQNGAAWRVRHLLAEMEEQQIELESPLCHTILKVLAVHPDHLLREDILGFMQSRWLHLTDDGHIDIIIGCLREGCFEAALDQMDKMRERKVVLPLWLQDMVAYVLSDAGEMAMAYQLMRRRWNSGEELTQRGGISGALWHWLLDKSSAALYHPMTEFIWRTRVQTSRTQASTGMCINVMSTAARAGDPTLATQVFAYITKRAERVTALHFQLLIDSYMNCSTPDLERALSVLALMSLEKLPTTHYHTRSIYKHLKDSPAAIDSAFHALCRLRDEGKSVPIAALNVVIEAHCTAQNLEGAMHVYKQAHSFSKSRRQHVEIQTFHHLLKACRGHFHDGAETDQAEFLFEELLASGLQPDLLVYDRLVLVFAKASSHALSNGDVELSRRHVHQAYQYLQTCRDSGFTPRYGTIELLSSRLADLGDARCWDLFQTIIEDYPEEVKDRIAPARAKLEVAWQQANARGLVQDVIETAEAAGVVPA